MPYAGRGGAGNIQAVQQETARVSGDLEANSPPPTFSQPGAAAAAILSPPPQYAHSGRGGAGNYYSPKELRETGTYQDLEMGVAVATAASDKNDALQQQQQRRLSTSGGSSSSMMKTYGRGGAGNYLFDVSETQERALRKKLEAEEARREKLAADIVQSVDDRLALPPKAKLAAEQPW